MAIDREQSNTHLTNLVLVFRTETSDPSGANVGDMYYNTSTNSLCYYTGNNWIAVAFN
mgnify:CR=1 FL=1